MPFGLQYALGIFRRTMDVILSPVKWQFAVVYFHDIVIFSRSPTGQLAHDHKVFTHLNNARVTLTLKKCRFFTETTDHLEHIICPRKHETSLPRTEEVRVLKASSDMTERHSFLEICNVFGRFVPTFAKLAAPLNKKLWRDQPSTSQMLI